MKKTTLILLICGFSVLMSAKCLELFEPYIGFPVRTTDLTDEPKAVKNGQELEDAPVNDDCANAIAITSMPYINLQSDAATATNNNGSIDVCNDDSMNDGVWYTVVGDGNAIKIVVTPTDDEFDLQIGVFTGSCDALECSGSVDNEGAGDTETIVISASIPGTTYYINIGSYEEEDEPEENFTIDVRSIGIPLNDTCANATVINGLPYTYLQTDVVGATNNDGFIETCEDNMNDGVWYTLTGDGSNIKITVTPNDSNFNPQIGVFTGSCDALECVGTIDNELKGHAESYTIVNSVIGTTYYVNVGDASEEDDNLEGDFTINVKTVIPPANDACANPITITALPYTHNQTDGSEATNNDGFIAACGGNIAMNDGLWYAVSGDGNNIVVTVDPDSGFDPRIGVYTGSCDALECAVTVDNEGAGGLETVVISNSIIGTTYYINIGDYSSTYDDPEGNFTIDVKSEVSPDNDNCAGATVITSMPYSLFQSNAILSTNNDGMVEVCGGGENSDNEMNDGLWYTVTGDGNYIIINVIPDGGDGSFDAKIGAYTGNCDALECVGSADNDGYGGAEVYVIENSVVGATYYINVGSSSGEDDEPEGNFTIKVKSTPLPDSAPDCISNAYPANEAVDVPVGNLTLTWDTPTTGTEVDSYDLYISTELPITEFDLLGNYLTTSATISVSGYDGLFYWKAVPKNLAGEAEGCTEFSFTTVSPPLVPANDACATATGITTFPFLDSFDAGTATNNDGFITACEDDGMNDGVWYTVTGNGSDITINATSANWDGKLGVYTGSCGDFTCYKTEDDGLVGATETIVINDSEAGTMYYINFGHYYDDEDGEEGVLTMEVTTTALGVGGNEFKDFAAYPNPVKDVLNLSYVQNITNVTVFNLLGQQVIAKTMNANQSQIDMSALASGTYLVKVTADSAVKTIKVIKQ